VALRALDLIEATRRDPTQGIGHPEPLKHSFKGCWSRRLTSEHRMIYRIFDDRINFLQARFHYE
jgi:toxin YoeB